MFSLNAVGVLINNVGRSYPFPQYFHELEDEVADSLVRLNVESVVVMTKLVLTGMLQRRRGAIVNISSAAGIAPAPLLSEYGATKKFVELFSKGLAAEYAAKGIDVQVQSPLYITTKLAKIRKSSWLTPTPKQYARAGVKCIGQETFSQPWWAHGLVMGVASMLPDAVNNSFVASMHLGIRKKALKKLEKQEKAK